MSGGQSPQSQSSQTQSQDASLRQLIQEEIAKLTGQPQGPQGQGQGSSPQRQPGEGQSAEPGQSAEGQNQPAQPAEQNQQAAQLLQQLAQFLQGGQTPPASSSGPQTQGFAGLQSGSGSQAEMQISQELAANLKKLKAVIAETQEIAKKIETAVQDGAGGQGAKQGQQQGQGRGS